MKVDDKEVASRKVPRTNPFLMAIDETFEVGVDTRTPVDDKDYHVPFRSPGRRFNLFALTPGGPQICAPRAIADDKLPRVQPGRACLT